MFKCPLTRENNQLNYEFPNSVFFVESVSLDLRRDNFDVRVVGFADAFAYQAYMGKLANAQYHDLERSMVFNRNYNVKRVDIDKAIAGASDEVTGISDILNAAETVIIANEEMFKNAVR